MYQNYPMALIILDTDKLILTIMGLHRIWETIIVYTATHVFKQANPVFQANIYCSSGYE